MGIEVKTATETRPAKRAPLVPIPADAPRMPSLDNHKKECGLISEQIKKLIQDIKESRDKDNSKERDDVRKGLIDQQKALISQKREATQQISKLREELKATFDRVKSARQKVRDGERECRQTVRDQASLDPKEIDRQIKDLEFKLESGGVSSIKGEKKVMQQIKDLNAQKAKAKDTAALIDSVLTNAEGARDVASNAAQHAEALQAKMDLQRATVQGLLDQIQAKSDEIDAHHQNSEAKKAREERDEMQAQIEKKRKTLTELNEQFDAKKAKYQAWKVDYDKLCDIERERRRKEREEEDKRRDEERKEKELLMQSIRRMNPYETEINAAETLIDYLRGKIGGALPAKKTEEVKKVEHFDPNAALAGKLAKGFKVVGKKDEDDGSLTFGKKKKNDAPSKRDVKPAAAAKKVEETPKVVARKPLKHSSEKYAAFEKLGVRMPQYTDEVKTVIDQLKEKKAEWESHKKTEKEAMMEEQAERIKARAAAEAAKADEE